MQILRTPAERFADIPDYPFAEHWFEVDLGEGLTARQHYVDEGPKDAVRTYLCLHGEPSWAYLYRKMIPVFLDSGARVIAPDWLGFGRSDKPVDDAVYTFSFHRDMMIALIERLNLKNVTLVCQDWGGLLGLTIPMDMPQRFERLIVMNTAIATGQSPSEGFDNWKAYMRTQPDVDVAALMKRGTPVLSDAEAAAYGAPFPDASYKAGVRRFPALVQTRPDMDGVDTGLAALDFWQNKWAGESFMAIGMQDPVLGPPAMQALRKVIRGCPEPLELHDAGHFVQEVGAPIVDAALASFADS